MGSLSSGRTNRPCVTPAPATTLVSRAPRASRSKNNSASSSAWCAVATWSPSTFSKVARRHSRNWACVPLPPVQTCASQPKPYPSARSWTKAASPVEAISRCPWSKVTTLTRHAARASKWSRHVLSAPPDTAATTVSFAEIRHASKARSKRCSKANEACEAWRTLRRARRAGGRSREGRQRKELYTPGQLNGGGRGN